MSETVPRGPADSADPERRQQVLYLAKQLKIPRREADRLLANMEADR